MTGKLSHATRGIAAFLAAAALCLALALAGYVTWRLFRASSVAGVLPARDTVFFAEADSLSLPSSLLQASGVGNLASMLPPLSGATIADVAEAVHGRTLGLALLRQGKAMQPVFFIGTRGRKRALEALADLAPLGALENTGPAGMPVYRFKEGPAFSFAFAGTTLALASSPGVLLRLGDTLEAPEQSLQNDPGYQKALGNLPRHAWLKGYFALSPFDASEAVGDLGAFLLPLKVLFKGAGFAVRSSPSGLHFNTYVSLDPAAVAFNHRPASGQPPAYELTRFLPAEKLLFYMGGANLEGEWLNTLETLSQLNPAYGLIVEGLLRARAEAMFGSGVSLRNDIYPLLKGQYALALSRASDGSLAVSLLLSHRDRDFADIKLGKLFEGFRTLAGQHTPKTLTVTLPDGTEARELVANPDQLAVSEGRYRGWPVRCVNIAGSSYGFCTTLSEDLIVLSNKREALEQTINLHFEPRFTLAQHQPFRQTLSNLSQVNDETSFLNVPAFAEAAGSRLPAMGQKILQAFEAATWVKHTFDDGVSAEGFILAR